MSLFDRIKGFFTGSEEDKKEEPSREAKPDRDEKLEEADLTEDSVADLSHADEVFEAEKADKDHAESEKLPAEIESPEEAEADPAVEEVETGQSETERYEEGLEKSRKSLGRRFKEFFARFNYVDEEFFDDLEDELIQSDVGFEATLEISDKLREEAALENISTVDQAEELVVKTMVDLYEKNMPSDTSINIQKDGLTVILMVGVNGVGKTTSIAKMAHHYLQEGKSVMLAAGDTFRAGAIEQLQVWGDRLGVEVIASNKGGDPAAVAFDAVKTAQEKDIDVLFIDSAGRLQNKKNLMNELEKINRIIARHIPDAPHETLLVLDATTGQNALSQAKEFKATTDISGIVLTKMDGTAKGGIVLAIGKELGIPVKFVGFGESMDDLRPFDTDRFAYGLFSDLVEDMY